MRLDHRYDQLMRGFYTAQVSGWLDPAKAPWFLRESRRRRVELSALVRKRWPCATYYARCIAGEELIARVCHAFGSDTRPQTSLVEAIHAALVDELRGSAVGLDLLRYESLLDADVALPAGERRGDVTLVELEHDIPTAYPHLQHLRSALASPSMVLELPIARARTTIAIKDVAGRRIVAPVEP